VNTPSPPRRRRLWRWLAAFVVGCVALIGGSLAVEDFMIRKAWTDACAEADRLDPGWRWDELLAARPVVAEGRGVGGRVLEICHALPPRWPDWATLLRDEDLPPPQPPPPPIEGIPPGMDFLPTPEDRRREFGDAAEGTYSNMSPAQQLPPGQAAALRIALAAAADGLMRTDGLENLSTGRLNRAHSDTVVADVFPAHLTDVRTVARLLRMRAQIRALDGGADAAVLDARRILVVSRFAGAEPSFMSKLVQMAVRSIFVGTVEGVLAQGEPSPAALAELQRAICADFADPAILNALRGERAYIEDTIRALDDGRLTYDRVHIMDEIPKVTGVEKIDRWLRRFRGGGSWTKPSCAEVLRYQSYLIEIVKESPDALRSRANEVAAYRNKMGESARMATDTYDKYIQAEWRSRALLSSAAVALAAEQFRRTNSRWPESLAELVTAKVLDAVPPDPFDGKPLRMRRLSDGIVIYSVGPDLNDDGGEVRVDPKVGGLSKDLGVRLWDLAQRRQAAKPPIAKPRAAYK
jgi:hypothetical protein